MMLTKSTMPLLFVLKQSQAIVIQTQGGTTRASMLSQAVSEL